MVSSLVGFAELVIAILPVDGGIIFTAMALEKRIKSLMKNKESKPLVKVESPLFWLKTCIVFSSFSLLASLAYLIVRRSEFDFLSLVIFGGK